VVAALARHNHELHQSGNSRLRRLLPLGELSRYVFIGDRSCAEPVCLSYTSWPWKPLPVHGYSGDALDLGATGIEALMQSIGGEICKIGTAST
jgi:hypothetical protein